MKTIIPGNNEEFLHEAVAAFSSAKKTMALTGAGISVGSGIPDFRSPGGVWTIYSPDEYATIDVFLQDPDKAWKLYRELGKGLLGRKPNPAHQVLADLEQGNLLHGIVTQNVDNLHQHAGSRVVFEIHGDHQHLQCIECGYLEPVVEEHYTMDKIPVCADCRYPLKPNIVLFGEAVRSIAEIEFYIADCDLLLVIGTSAKVYPAASLPSLVKQNGGRIFEFNMEPALNTSRLSGPTGMTDYFFEGDLGVTLPLFGREVFKNLNRD